MTRWWIAPTAVALASLSGCGDNTPPPAADASPACRVEQIEIDSADPPPIYSPRWVFEPWISKDISTTEDTRAFVAGFRERDIPVGVVVLDSPWETHYNTFVPNPERYPDFAGLVDELHADGIRLVLWTTQMVNRTGLDLEDGGDRYEGESPNFADGERCGFYVNGGTTYFWWKGLGAGIDFFNPDAVAWWHRQQDSLLDLGIDGWKLDFAENYLPEPIDTAAGEMSVQDYSEAYYRDFYAYGAARRGRDFVTMVRPYDRSYQFPGRFFARPEHAPVGWVGDNRRDFVGLADALDHILRSAAAGYVVVGSDIGGYLDVDDQDLSIDIPFDAEVFARWTAVAALTPFFQLHGRANLAPWTVPEAADETVALYRYWAVLHSELVPLFYSLAEASYAGGATLLRPVGGETDWQGDYRFRVGDSFLVAPIVASGGTRSVALPAGDDWYDWWDPAAPSIAGGSQVEFSDGGDRARIPLYVAAGAIIPAAVHTDVTGLGTAASSGHLTVLVYPATRPSSFVIHDEDGMTTEVTAMIGMITLSRRVQPVILRLRTDEPIAEVTVDGAALAEQPDRPAFDSQPSGWLADPGLRAIWVKLPGGGGATIALTTATR